MTSNGGERIHTVQPERDLVANWEVDLSEKLEEYLLKICTGEITGNEEEDGKIPVNFAEGLCFDSEASYHLIFFRVVRKNWGFEFVLSCGGL